MPILDGRRVGLYSSLLVVGVASFVKLFLDCCHIQVSYLGAFSVEYSGEFFECRATGFDIEEVDEKEFQEDPDL
jgi:hypothetical protein